MAEVGGSDGEDFDAFYRAEYGRLTASLRLATGDAGLAEELSQEAFVRALTAWVRVGRLDRPAGWLYRTAFNLLRKRWKRHPPDDVAQASCSPADAGLTRLVLRDALARITADQRVALVARYALGFPTEEVAAMLGRSPDAVRALLHRGAAALRAQPELSEPGEAL